MGRTLLGLALLMNLAPVQSTRPPLVQRGTAAEPQDVSIVQLIATPERFDGKLIRAIGFLRLEFEGNALYLHETDFCRRISANAVWADVGSPAGDDHAALNNGYVLIEGVFNARSKGHMGMFAGSIHQVRRLSGWMADAEPRRCDPKAYLQR